VRVLLVDPDTACRRDIGGALATAGYFVSSAASGLEALMAIDRASDRPELLVTEIVLPELDGFSLVRAIRNNPATRAIGVVFVSARVDPLTVAQAVALNARYFVMKPFVVEDVVRKVQDAISYPARPRP
jgi:CheY-like chemotaxis protein